MTRLYLIDIPTRSPSAAQTHITPLCELVAEPPAARGHLNIHEGAFKAVLQHRRRAAACARKRPRSRLCLARAGPLPDEPAA